MRLTGIDFSIARHQDIGGSFFIDSSYLLHIALDELTQVKEHHEYCESCKEDKHEHPEHPVLISEWSFLPGSVGFVPSEQ
jgi:hypothetical protein